jgi:ADP-heptose:LPS heptosyltransferase
MTRNRLGFYRHSTAFKNGIYTHLVYFNTRMPVRQLYLQLGRVIGVPSAQSEKTGPIRVEDADRSSVAGLLSQHSEWRSDQPYVVINPNASDLLLERRWPTQSVVETISRLVSLGHQVALIGARNELPYVKGLFDHLPSEVRVRVVNTAGALTLGGMLALLDGAACVLTNDSGPMHIAVALERPTVCLFGPANPEHYGHELPNVANFYAPVFCSPCLYEADQPPCNGNNICMQRIKPEPVIQAVLRLLGASSADAQVGVHPTDLPIISDAPDGSPLGVVVRASLGRDIR